MRCHVRIEEWMSLTKHVIKAIPLSHLFHIWSIDNEAVLQLIEF